MASRGSFAAQTNPRAAQDDGTKKGAKFNKKDRNNWMTLLDTDRYASSSLLKYLLASFITFGASTNPDTIVGIAINA